MWIIYILSQCCTSRNFAVINSLNSCCENGILRNFYFVVVYHNKANLKWRKQSRKVGWPLLKDMVLGLVPTMEFKSVGHTMNRTSRHKINFIIQVKDDKFILITPLARKPQKILLCGWRRDIDDMIVVSPVYWCS